MWTSPTGSLEQCSCSFDACVALHTTQLTLARVQMRKGAPACLQCAADFPVPVALVGKRAHVRFSTLPASPAEVQPAVVVIFLIKLRHVQLCPLLAVLHQIQLNALPSFLAHVAHA